MTTLRTISYGGGVQSTALLVLAAQGKIDATMGGPVTHAVFANVGDDSEDPRTLRYINEQATPFANAHGITIVQVRRAYVDGREYESLREFATSDARAGIPIPLYGSLAGAPGKRTCTASWKIEPIAKWHRAHGASSDKRAHVAIGISTDEIERAGRGRDAEWERRVYPLLDLGLNRADCERTIKDAGLGLPVKSSCYFCPFHSMRHWREMRRDQPALFDASLDLENRINTKRHAAGKTPMYLTKTGRALDLAVTEAQTPLFDHDGPESCDSGYCWT